MYASMAQTQETSSRALLCISIREKVPQSERQRLNMTEILVVLTYMLHFTDFKQTPSDIRSGVLLDK